MNTILVTGSLAFDYIMDFPGIFADHIMPDKIHQINLSFLVNTLKKHRGGTAGNIAYTLTLLQTKTSILGTAGDDFTNYASFLTKNNVDTSHIKIIAEESTATAFITTDKKDNQISAFYPGAMTHADTLHIADVEPKPSFAIISPNSIPAAIHFATECQKNTIPYMFDPGMMLPRLTNEELTQGIQRATILIGNDYEMSLLKERLKMNDSDLLKHIKILITTLGPDGSQITTKKETITIKPVKPQEVLDPTGAGDAYRAGFMAGYIRNFDLQTCGQMGSVASVFAIEKYGTQKHKFTIDQFTKRYKQTFNETIKL